MDGLPEIVPITQDSFSGENFSVEGFLNDHHKYQTLDDLQRQMRKWKGILDQQLVDTINSDYGKFVELGRSLAGAEPKLQDVKMEVLGFERQVGHARDTLQSNVTEMDRLLHAKRDVTAKKNHVKSLMAYAKRLSYLEQEAAAAEALVWARGLVILLRQQQALRRQLPNNNNNNNTRGDFVEKQHHRVTAVKEAVERAVAVDIEKLRRDRTDSERLFQLQLVSNDIRSANF
ncbi:hypothetical protein TRVA0_051S00562 [Trichomonascus vanleenenianus]|uniref:uncharacterized protein n=1 Tax=Trichomonascus vanleenenianus TaxID=2268995 RepID=UPI003EC983A1